MFSELLAPVGFQSLYQGQPANRPIVLSTSVTGLDEKASAQLSALKNIYSRTKTFPISSNGNGVSPFLVAGLPVPLFATVNLHIPGVNPGSATDPPLRYKYVLIWRTRSFATAAGGGNPFHGRNSSLGQSDDGSLKFSPPIGGPAWSGTSVNRFPIIASGDSMDYVQAEPSATGTSAEDILYETITAIDPPQILAPIFPGFVQGQLAYGDVSQGITQNPSASQSVVRHVTVTRRAYGDELVVLVYRNSDENTLNWNFEAGGADENFPTFYGTGNVRDGTRSAGLLVSTGVAP